MLFLVKTIANTTVYFCAQCKILFPRTQHCKSQIYLVPYQDLVARSRIHTKGQGQFKVTIRAQFHTYKSGLLFPNVQTPPGNVYPFCTVVCYFKAYQASSVTFRQCNALFNNAYNTSLISMNTHAPL